MKRQHVRVSSKYWSSMSPDDEADYFCENPGGTPDYSLIIVNISIHFTKYQCIVTHYYRSTQTKLHNICKMSFILIVVNTYKYEYGF